MKPGKHQGVHCIDYEKGKIIKLSKTFILIIILFLIVLLLSSVKVYLYMTMRKEIEILEKEQIISEQQIYIENLEDKLKKDMFYDL